MKSLGLIHKGDALIHGEVQTKYSSAVGLQREGLGDAGAEPTDSSSRTHRVCRHSRPSLSFNVLICNSQHLHLSRQVAAHQESASDACCYCLKCSFSTSNNCYQHLIFNYSLFKK